MRMTMRIPRRRFLNWAAGVVALPAISRGARAETYPSRPVRWVVGYAPGGGNDIVARLMGQWLQERLGQPFVVENRPGGGTNLATEAVINATPDGYTLLLAGLPNASNATLYNNLKFNFMRDVAPIAGIVRIANVLAIGPSVPARTVPEFIAYSKANAGKINMGSAGVASAGHLAGELFKVMAGVDLTHVPYRGNGPALTALLGGQVDVLFASIPSAAEFIKSGKLRGLGVTSASRSVALPEIPTIGESVADYEMSAWFGAVAPKGTPAEIVGILNKAINAGLTDPGMKARFADLGGAEIAGTPDDLARLIGQETEKWAKVIRVANLKAD